MPPRLSANRIKRLGAALREERLTEESEFWPTYVDYLTRCDQVRAEVESRVRASLPQGVIVTGRTKSRDTLREKLQRTPTIQLPNIDDVIGVRVVGDFTLSEQDAIADALGSEFDGALKTRDRRSEPSAGYRALHVIVKAEDSRAEIQVRTRLQAEWADVFERLADKWGRQIRYGLPPDPDSAGVIEARETHIRAIQELSTKYIASYEVALSEKAAGAEPVVPTTRELRNQSRQALVTAMRLKEADKRLADASNAFTEALDAFRDSLLVGLDELARESASIP